MGRIKSFGDKLFSSINRLDQSYFRLRLSLKLGYFPVIMFKKYLLYATNVIYKYILKKIINNIRRQLDTNEFKF